MKQALHLKLSQQLTLTPQLKQSLKLLQLPSLDLEHEIQQALDSNPLLERVETEQQAQDTIQTVSPSLDNGIPQPVGEASDPNFEIERTDNLAPEQDLSTSWEEPSARYEEPSAGYQEPSANYQELSAGFEQPSTDYQESFESQRATHASTSNNSAETEFTQFAIQQESLFEHLEWQIKMTTLSAKDQQIATAILHCLDNDGYLTANLDEIARMITPALEVDEDEVNAVLSLIKTLDPLGVGAFDLPDRLLILLKNSTVGTDDERDLAKKIIETHIDLVAAHNLAKLKKELAISDQELSKALGIITSLNPRIAARFSSDNENYITPDVIVKKVADTWVAQLNSENQAKLRVNDTYSDLLNSSSNLDKQSNDFIQHHLSEAKNFIKGLMSRYDTLQLVAQAIVERQQDFFEKGEAAMQPMVLQDIANALEMHESTISRATSGKYLHSPRGVFELKYFFSSAVSTTDGATSSSTAIRSLIKAMINAEPKAKPLSDNKIAKELEQQGHIVARRTVAKYRESMQIAPSSQRKSLVG